MKIASVEITHPEKLLFPQKKITKGQVAEYYFRVANKMLPYLKNRPLTLVRYPQGVTKKGFFQKNASEYFPDYIKRVEIETEEGINTQFICNNLKSLIYLANQNSIEFHIWLSKKDKLRQPDKVIFDLDPPDTSFIKVKKAAVLLREYLEKRKKKPQLATTGKKGLHISYKIRRGKAFDEVKAEVEQMAEELVDLFPDLLTTTIRKDQREGKIFVDYLRNAYAQTAVCPFSLRANEEAGIATPIEWEELEDLKSSSHFNYSTFHKKP